MNYNRHHVIKRMNTLTGHSKKAYHKLLVWAIRVTLVLVISTVVLGTALVYGGFRSLIDNTSDIEYSDVTPTGYMTRIYDSTGGLMQTLVTSGANREEVTLSRMPQDLLDAFVAIEDERFWVHNGIDLKGILRAGIVGIVSGDFSEGASTITQQLIKNSIFDGGREQTFGAQIERKIQEQALALRLEQTLSKNIILEKYLNTINLGNNTLGVQAASKRYFNKDVSDLTLSECAVIAAITQNPSALNPIRYPQNNQARQQRILKNMLEQNMITRAEYDAAIADDVYSRIYEKPADTSISTYSYFTDALIEQVLSDLQNRLGYTRTQAHNLLYSGGLSIESTMNPEIQGIMDATVNDPDNYPYTYYSISYKLNITRETGETVLITQKEINEYAVSLGIVNNDIYYETLEDIDYTLAHYKENILSATDTIVSESLTTTLEPQVSMVIIDQSTGQVVAITGGRGEKTGSLTLNRATDSTRQPGSCFKVLSTFAPALDTMGVTLATTYEDLPVTHNGHTFNNWWGDEFLGRISVRDCIAYSMNLGTLQCLMETVSISLAYEYLESFGITTLVDSRPLADGTIISDRVPSLCLGGLVDGVTNLEMTNAYATIANQGVYTEPIYYTRILDQNGKVLLENEPTQRKVLKDTTASLLTYAMENTMEPPSTSKYLDIDPNIIPTGNDCYFEGMHLAGKSGSTTDQNDLWFVGYTPYYTCGIWSGYDVGQAEQTGGIYHKLIWQNVMSQVHSSLSDISWAENDSIVTAKVCSKSGLLAIEGVCDHETSNGVVYYEYFDKNTVPTQTCSAHIKIDICTESELPAGKYCPADCREERVYMIVTAEPPEEDIITDDMLYAFPEEFKDHSCDLHNTPESSTAPEEESVSEENTVSIRKTQ